VKPSLFIFGSSDVQSL